MKFRDITTGTAIAALALSGSAALAAETSSLPWAKIDITKQPVKVRPNSGFSISGFVGSRPVDPKGGTITLTAISGQGKRPTVTVRVNKHKGFNARVRAGNGKVVRYRITYKNPDFRAPPVKTRLIKVSK